MDRKYAFPSVITSEDVRGLRNKLNMTQKEFAELMGVSRPTAERWEREDKKIEGPETLLFDILFEHPELVQKKRIVSNDYKLHLYYMYHDKVCTVIDVDEANRRVEITNYTNILIYRAFGSVTSPTYEEYEEFLESRCFPRTRDKMKLQLAELGLPFYDTLMIIEKTQGRMEEDDFWIDIVR